MADLVQIRRPGQPEATATPSPAGANPSLQGAPISDEPRVLPPADREAVYVETFGCQMNEADSALIRNRLRSAGFALTDGPDDADVILVNTCAVREKAEERVYGRTSSLARLRKQRPHLVIGITGCMAEHLRDRLAKSAPQVNLLAGPDNYRDIDSLVQQALDGERAVALGLNKQETYEGLDADPRDDGVSGFVTIQRGCDKFCTFCVVPFTRGRERAVPPREVLRQVRMRAEAGYREITLLGQTVNSYRFEDVNFPALLKAVCRVPGIERVRFTSPYPVDFTDELIQTLAEEPKLCRYVHLPLQSGSDTVLERMRRGHTRAEYLEIVRKLRAIPDMAISTDILVGFCGETEADHEETLSLMREVKFDMAFMFHYSDRDITYAAKKLVDDVPQEVKSRRLREVIELQEAQTRAVHEARVGKDEEILVTGPSKRGDRLVGRNHRFESVLLPIGSARPGELVRRRIARSSGHSLFVEADPTTGAPN